MRVKYLLCFLLPFLGWYSASGQDRRLSIGGFIRSGISNGINGRSALLDQSVEDYTYTANSVGLYGFYRLRKADSIQRVFQFIKFDLATAAVRSGAFDNGNGAIVKVRGISADFSALLPLVFKVSKEAEGYAGIGLNASYTYNRSVTPNNTILGAKLPASFKGGYVIELGFKFGPGSVVGLRMLSEFAGAYPNRELALLLGFCPTERLKKKS